MKKNIITFFLLFAFYFVNAQENRADILQDLEKSQPAAAPANQDVTVTATLKSASRLFGEKDDLTTVITVLPSGSVVEILDSDSTYYMVSWEDYEGYIFKRHAVINESVKAPAAVQQEVTQQAPPVARETVRAEPAGEQQVSRFTYLENKYGTSMAAKLMSGKIWKGMDAEMINDSWGTPKKINRVISGNLVKEEWIFKNTWLYIENDVLRDWGPIR